VVVVSAIGFTYIVSVMSVQVPVGSVTPSHKIIPEDTDVDPDSERTPKTKLALQADFMEDNSVPLIPRSVPVASTVGPMTMVEVSLDRNPGRYSA
jgi:hypothetical protein